MEKVDLEKQLVIVATHSRSQQKAHKSSANDQAIIVRLERLLRQKDLNLEICDHDLRALRHEKQVLYDMASDAQLYAIAIERLQKAKNDPYIVWPHRPFMVSLKGIRE